MSAPPAHGVAGRPSPVHRVAQVLPALLVGLIALKTLGPVRDPDAFWHVRTGELLTQTGEFVLTDPLGAGTEKTWILNQWLPELLMHWAHRAFGLAGVAWLLCLGAVLVGLAVWAACRRESSPLVTALVLAITFVALSGSLSPRPQLVTFALTALVTSAWLRTRADGLTRWWLVPVSWVWAMSHGMWFLGPVIGLAVVAGMVLDRGVSWKGAAKLAAIPALSVAVAAATPVGPRLFTSPFQVGGVTAYISEWQRPSLADPAVLAALVLVAVVVVDLVARRRWSWSTVALTALALLLALLWARTVGIAAVVAAPMAAAALQRLVRRREPVTGRERGLVVAVAAAGLATAGVLAPGVAASPGIGPTSLDPALRALPAGTVVCNEQGDGGWMLLQHPNLRPTMDTRVELYSVDRILAYHDFMAGRPGGQGYVDRVGCTYAALPDDIAAVPALVAAGWDVIESTGGYVLLRG